MMKLPKNMHICAMCRYWRGYQNPDRVGNNVEIDEHESAECLKKESYVKMWAQSSGLPCWEQAFQ